MPGMEPKFIEPPLERSQLLLMPPSVDEWVRADDPVRVYDDCLDAVDFRALIASYGSMGRPAYDPVLMFKLLSFAYRLGVTSSRRIAELARSDVRAMWLVKGCRPDFHTVARFRKEKGSFFRMLFEQSARLCVEADLVSMSLVAVDGTKLLANASRRSLKKPEQLRMLMAEFDRLTARGKREDAEEDGLFGEGEGPKLPLEYSEASGRKERLRKLRERLDEGSSGRISTTDPEAPVMKTKEGLAPGYNGEVAVDEKSQVIVGAHLTTNQNDHGELTKVLDDVERAVGVRPEVVAADAGFSDGGTLCELAARGQDALMVVEGSSHKEYRNEWFGKSCFVYDAQRDVYVCPMGERLRRRTERKHGSGRYVVYWRAGCHRCAFHKECVGRHRGTRQINRSVLEELRESMRKRVSEASALYARRASTVEPVFGQMKRNHGFTGFRVRGFASAEGEFYLMCFVLNVGRWVKARMPAAGFRSAAAWLSRVWQTATLRAATAWNSPAPRHRTTHPDFPTPLLQHHSWQL